MTRTVFGVQVSLVDLSHPLGPTASEPVPPSIEHTSHRNGAEFWDWMFDIPADAVGGGGLAAETVHASTHAGTHVDAPWHFGPSLGAEPAPTIDQVPLEWFVGDLIVVDVEDLVDGDVIEVPEIDHRLDSIDAELRDGVAVAFRTGAARWWGNESFWERGSGLDADGVAYLVESGVRLIGTDAWSLDRPYPLIGAEWRERRDPDRLWPAHLAGRRYPHVHAEKLANLDKVPSTGSVIVAAPVKVDGGSAGWVRAFAMVPEHT